MKNFENYGVKEINNSSAKLIDGGSWLGRAIGVAVGTVLRYYGPVGTNQALIDYSLYRAENS